MFTPTTYRAGIAGASFRASAILVVFAALLVEVAAAQQKKSPTYEVSVWAIRATKSNNEVSPELKPIVKELRKQGKYTGFKLERKKTGKVNEGKTFAADLIAGFKAKVTPVERKDRRIKLKIEITRRQGKDKKETQLLNTAVTLSRSKFHLQGGWKIDPKSEDVLIVAVSAR
jgi:hypothetical protein